MFEAPETVLTDVTIVQAAGRTDFANVDSGDCVPGRVYKGRFDGGVPACTFDVAFTPQSVGAIAATVVLKGASGVVASAPVRGEGVRPQPSRP